MKKRILLLMTTAVLALGLTACGASAAPEQGAGTESDADSRAEVSSALEILETVWASYSEDDKPIVFGGDASQIVDGAPGAYDVSDAAGIDAQFHISADAAAMADDAASAVHAMNANTFTASVFHMADAADTESFVASEKESVLATQWMCGFPEKLVILTVNDDYVVSAFGNGDMIDLFETKLTDAYGEAAAELVNEVIE